MTESTTIVAFDQHADSVVAAVLRPGERVPAVRRYRRTCRGSGALLTNWSSGGACIATTRRGPAALRSSGF
jgi:hypothetical protein